MVATIGCGCGCGCGWWLWCWSLSGSEVATTRYSQLLCCPFVTLNLKQGGGGQGACCVMGVSARRGFYILPLSLGGGRLQRPLLFEKLVPPVMAMAPSVPYPRPHHAPLCAPWNHLSLASLFLLHFRGEGFGWDVGVVFFYLPSFPPSLLRPASLC